MRCSWIFILLVFILVTGCNIREKEDQLNQKEQTLKQKEQELLLKEKTLQLKEEELISRTTALDSLQQADTTRLLNDSLVGSWIAKMICKETTCPGSAVGDTKTETWHISYQGNSLIARAMVNDQLVRAYTGLYTGNTLELIEDKTTLTGPAGTKMIARIRLLDEGVMEGEREITREDNCRILYALRLEKNK